jgi:glycolate oxidase
VASGAGPLILEYIDQVTMAAITQREDIDLGVPVGVRDSAVAYLVVMLEDNSSERLGDGVTALAELLDDCAATDVYVLPAGAAGRLITAREKAFWAAKEAGADDIVDTVVPRAAMAGFLGEAAEIAASHGSLVMGCGHAGDGNVHLALFSPEPAKRGQVLREIFAAASARGGQISGEHGIGTSKKSYFLELADPAAVTLMRRIKEAFDPAGILGPGVTLR